MTREDAISIMNVIVHMLEEKYDTDRVEEAVDMAIKALEHEPKWIPVSERLPKKDGCYLVNAEMVVGKPRVEISSFAKNLYSVDEFDFLNKMGESGWYIHDSEYGYWEIDDAITAWMPLPKPYRSESEE